MNTYVLKDPNGNTVATLHANDMDAAWEQAFGLLGEIVSSGSGYTIERQLTASATSIDPLWILLGLLAVAMLWGNSRRRRLH